MKIVQCPSCGWIQLSNAAKRFSCKRCGKSAELRNVKIIKVVDSVLKAQAIMRALRERH